MKEAYAGFLSLAPHLAEEERWKGFDEPARFSAAAQALKGLLGEAGIVWN